MLNWEQQAAEAQARAAATETKPLLQRLPSEVLYTTTAMLHQGPLLSPFEEYGEEPREPHPYQLVP